jgi:hypothetical protein
MSNLFENKTMIAHIAVESVIILGVTIYFSQKNKKLMGHINDLIHRIEEQEDIIQKHEQLINNLSNAINDINSKLSSEKNISSQNVGNNMKKSKNNNKYSRSTDNSLEETILKHMSSPSLNKNNSLKFHIIQPPPSIQKNSTNSKVEELDEEDTYGQLDDIDIVEHENESENNDENLDAELEDELNDLN